ncbi:MAG: hypothetical protein FWH27_15930 [Planctomycetaceae bacterium]|nr:hypothetical protein [Planctomycetaceae bacterium]
MQNEFDKTLTGVGYKGLKTKAGIRRYIEVNAVALISIVLGLIGVTTFFSWQTVFVPILGLLVGLWALYRHLDSPGEVGGFYLAIAGIVVSLVMSVGGSGLEIWRYYFSVPRGYTVVDFADMALDKNGKIPEHIAQLGRENKKILVKGYMYQSKQRSGLTNFILVRTVEHCKFCSSFQNPADMIDVYCVGGLKVNYRTTPVRVGGTFWVNEHSRFGDGTMPYLIEADQFR